MKMSIRKYYSPVRGNPLCWTECKRDRIKNKPISGCTIQEKVSGMIESERLQGRVAVLTVHAPSACYVHELLQNLFLLPIQSALPGNKR